jgi:hypothetical protein
LVWATFWATFSHTHLVTLPTSTGRELYDQHLRQHGRRYEEFSNDEHDEESTASSPNSRSSANVGPEPHGAVYGQNLGLHDQVSIFIKAYLQEH